MTKALSQMTTWEKRGLGKILYSVRWYRSFSLDRITSNPFHAELIISIVNTTFHYIVFHAQDGCILVQGVHFFTLRYNNFSEMGSYRSYRTYLNFPRHEIEMKQHFCNKLYILLAKHYNKQIGPKCEKFISVHWSLMTFGHRKEPLALAAMEPKKIWHTGHLNHKIGTIWIISPKKRLKAF